MSIKLLRWFSGSGGDTILKILLESNPNLSSQTRYIGLSNSTTEVDVDYTNSFEYNQIAKMSLKDAQSTDIPLLMEQLHQLEQTDLSKQWLLKTHCYCAFSQEVIDIVSGESFLPFVIKAGLAKNTRQSGKMIEYTPMSSKIVDPEVLYKFDCYNMITMALSVKNISALQLHLNSVFDSWSEFEQSLLNVNLHISQTCRQYYEQWIDSNKQFLPGHNYVSMVTNQDYNYNCKDLSIEERYCLLVLAGEKFRILK